MAGLVDPKTFITEGELEERPKQVKMGLPTHETKPASMR
jgi:hypothetical protein